MHVCVCMCVCDIITYPQEKLLILPQYYVSSGTSILWTAPHSAAVSETTIPLTNFRCVCVCVCVCARVCVCACVYGCACACM